MKRAVLHVLSGLLSLAVLVPASAAIIHFETTLSGPNENPPNASLGVGQITVNIDTVSNIMFVAGTFSGLTGSTTMSHIHCCTNPPGNVGVATLLPAFPNFPLGVTLGSWTSTLDLTLASSYNPAFIAANGGTAAAAEAVLLAGMVAGRSYFNIHTSSSPGGEIRGFLLAVPEPQTAALMGVALLAGLAARRRRR